MSRSDIDEHFRKIDELIREIDTLLPNKDGYNKVKIRADLAGLLVVAMAATYETCVKQVMLERARGKNHEFGDFATRNYEKLNSRVNISDLHRYCELFSPSIKSDFKSKLGNRKRKIQERTGFDIENSYEQILKWRHGFAHAWARSTTIEEVYKVHVVAKRVIYIFEQAFRT